MKGSITLDTVPSNTFALITSINADGPTRRRLLDLGLVPGTRVEVLQRSPMGDPVAYNIRGAVIALRKEESSQVQTSR
ncbi:MAG: ferrous iron transport protein A [Clostridiales bacterium]|nr:ferrous iron transport protein A [Clostridiales bacterium]MCF8021848.1 ferrous iron transport protein A [Clostridiales bacterium]